MGLLDKIKERSGKLRKTASERLRETREGAREIVDLVRHRTREKTSEAMARKGDGPREIRTDTADLGEGIFVSQKDENAISIAGREFSCQQLASSGPIEGFTQDDLNIDFVPFGWSCRLGSGEGTLFVAVYEGRNDGYKRGERIIIVKNSKGQILQLFRHANPKG